MHGVILLTVWWNSSGVPWTLPAHDVRLGGDRGHFLRLHSAILPFVRRIGGRRTGVRLLLLQAFRCHIQRSNGEYVVCISIPPALGTRENSLARQCNAKIQCISSML